MQSFRAGRELCSYSIAVNGELRAHAAYEPGYRLARSSSYYFDPVAEPRIESFVERFVRKTAFTGQISFDWIRGADGRLSVIECNPRAISGLHMFERTAPLPQAIIGGPLASRISPVNPQARMIGIFMLTAGLVSSIRAGHLGAHRARTNVPPCVTYSWCTV